MVHFAMEPNLLLYHKNCSRQPSVFVLCAQLLTSKVCAEITIFNLARRKEQPNHGGEWHTTELD